MTDDTSTKPYRVLTLDGGGMRGLYSAVLLETLAQRFNSIFKNKAPDYGSAFDLICGTSTGSILAAGIAARVPLSVIKDFYREAGPRIFTRPQPTGLRLWGWAFKFRSSPSSNQAELKAALKEQLGNLTFAQLWEQYHTALCIQTVDVTTRQAWVFKTPHQDRKTRDDNYTLADACLASSSAPIYLPVCRLKNPDADNSDQYFVDGGLWANNPVLTGILEALYFAKKGRPIHIFSVGTCSRKNGDLEALQKTNWGLRQWKVGIEVIETSLDAQAFGHMSMARLFAGRLKPFGIEMEVARLDPQVASAKQEAAMGLDRADKLALDTMTRLGESHADLLHSTNSPLKDHERVMLDRLFEEMKPLEGHTKEGN